MILADKRPNDFMSTLSNVKFHEVPLTALLSVTELELDILRAGQLCEHLQLRPGMSCG